MYNTMSAMSVRWRHAWPVTLAIHFDPQCFDLPRNTKLPVLYTTRDRLWSNVVWILARRLRRVNVSCLLGSAPVIHSRPNTATLTKCWASVVDVVPALKQRWLHVIVQRSACLPVKDVWAVCPRGIHNTQLTQGDVESMLAQHLSTIYNVGQTLSQLWFNVLSLLACQYTCMGPI